MPIYRHSKSLLKPRYSATGHRAGDGTVLRQHAIIEIDLGVRADSPAKVRAGEPAIELRRGRACGGKTVVPCIPAIDGSSPPARKLVVRRAGKGIARSSLEHA